MTSLALALASCAPAFAQDGRRPDAADQYPPLEAVYDRMRDAAARNPGFAEFIDLTMTYSVPTTHEGRHIFALKVSDNAAEREDEPNILVVAQHHGDELIASQVALHFMDKLLDGSVIDGRERKLVTDNAVFICPVWNPDGYASVRRLNARKNENGSTGVDLNRNYPFGWGTCGGSPVVGSATYRGPEPASEPETQTMIAFARDQRFARMHDLHAGAFEARVGYGCWVHPWNEFLLQEARASVQAGGMDAESRNSCCHAGDIHFNMSESLTFAVLWEVHQNKRPPIDQVPARAEQMYDAMFHTLARPTSISGHATDASTGEPVYARIELTTAGFEQGEGALCHGPAARYDLVLPPGQHTIRFSADGYEAIEKVVLCTPESEETLEVSLTPMPPANLPDSP